jgi:hypothetical protein
LKGARAAESREVKRVKGLDDAELKMAAEIAMEVGKGRGRSFDTRATALALCRASTRSVGRHAIWVWSRRRLSRWLVNVGFGAFRQRQLSHRHVHY